MREMKEKTDEAMQAIRDAEASKWKSELADVFEKFEVAGVDASYDEMLGKVKQKNAEAEGRLAMAADSIDTKAMEIDEKAEQLEGQELFKSFQTEMGVAADGDGKKEEAKKTTGMKDQEKA